MAETRPPCASQLHQRRRGGSAPCAPLDGGRRSLCVCGETEWASLCHVTVPQADSRLGGSPCSIKDHAASAPCAGVVWQMWGLR